ncbi:MAG: hypothetical protein B9S32_16765 [Verrucomicrobia bacterium Tous-C9LFEB]|nr:MAG: hypothetical protein B9S32_16765 [Verrucomicrobia bacterium Tous-C9LFEB]
MLRLPKVLTLFTLVAVGLATQLLAAPLTLDWKTDKEPVSYLPGEPITFTLRLLDAGKPLAGKTLKWTCSGDDKKVTNGETKSSDTEPLVIKTSLDKPGFVHVEVRVLNEDGTPINDEAGKPLNFQGGAGASPEKLTSIPEPADYDAFWAAQKKRLAEVPLKFTLTEVPTTKPGFQVFDVKVDCAGGKPVSGYLVKPVGAAPKTLPAQIGFMGYGIASVNPMYIDGKITFNINAHGIENGKDPAYYKQLADTELKGYAFNKEQNSKPETSYFNGMMLRVMRALEFLKAQPEWDGKSLYAGGGSQGGLQALAAAALDPDVTGCGAYKPWCCDLGGVTLERLKGWRPDYTEALGYYDSVNFAKRIKCPNVTISAGLGDYVCPPSTIAVLYNNLTVPKQIKYIQGATHGFNPPGAQEQTFSSK